MATPPTMDQAFQLGTKVLAKAGSDPTFRALALRDGTAAVEQVMGTTLPDGVKIRFVENDGAWLTLGLPPARTSDELSDRDLEAVAGGREDSGPSTGTGLLAASAPLRAPGRG